MTRPTPLTFLSLFGGLGLVFIGSRFLLSPEVAERGFGLRFAGQGDYAFHTIKGIRDLVMGLLIALFALTGQRRALATTLLLGMLIPVADGLLVLSRPEATLAAVQVHFVTAGFCGAVGTWLLVERAGRRGAGYRSGPQPGYVEVVQSAAAGAAVSELLMSIAPGTGTPAHAHYQFAETFTVLAGELLVTVDGQRRVLQAGESATVPPGQAHGFQNQSAEVCHIRVQIEPGNARFEDAMRVYYGLMRDGQATRSGTPRRPADLALFLQLSDSNLIGAGRIIQPVFNWLARRATRRGRLAELRRRYGLSSDQAVRPTP